MPTTEVMIMENAKMWGYARVSSTSQNLDRQIAALSDYGIEERQILLDQQGSIILPEQSFHSVLLPPA